MPSNSSPRKKYRPKPNDSVLFRFSDEDERRFQLVPHAQLCNLREGRADQETVDMLEFRIRWCEHLAKKVNLPEVVEQTGKSINCLREIHARCAMVSKYVTTQEEASTLGESLTLADELQVQSTRRELRDSLNSAMAYMKKTPLTSRVNSVIF
jgi:hypothetical protein